MDNFLVNPMILIYLRNIYRLLYEKVKEIFLNLHEILGKQNSGGNENDGNDKYSLLFVLDDYLLYNLFHWQCDSNSCADFFHLPKFKLDFAVFNAVSLQLGLNFPIIIH